VQDWVRGCGQSALPTPTSLPPRKLPPTPEHAEATASPLVTIECMQRHVARRRLVWSTPFLLHLCCKKGVCRPSFLRKPSPCVWPSFWRWLAYPQRARRTPRLQTLEASRTMCLTTSELLRSSECQSHTHTFSHSFITCHHDASSRATDATATLLVIIAAQQEQRDHRKTP
jgi:hypothetical protein